MNPIGRRHFIEQAQSGFQRANRIKKFASECLALELGGYGAVSEYDPDELVALSAPVFRDSREQMVIDSWLTHHPDVARLFINRTLSGVGRTESPTEFITDLSLDPDAKQVNVRLSDKHF